MKGNRKETDSLGTVYLPKNVYYGPQTQRAMDNFPISALVFPPAFIHALARIKKNAALVNASLGLMDQEKSQAISTAAAEILEGKFSDQFKVDIFQTGSGTSTNMNINEVLASRANELITGKRSGKIPVHPNDHVNLGQSSNDVIPTALHMAGMSLINDGLIPSLDLLRRRLLEKASEFRDVQKIGRTHLQDAIPMTLGEEFSGYAGQIELGLQRLSEVKEHLSELALGGTAVGTGVNTHPEFSQRVIALIVKETQLPFKETANHFQAQAAQDAVVTTSGVLRTLAVSLVKIANDIRWMASGPRCGLGEINIPSLQPGSSIMPGKVNPVLPEMMIQVAYQVMGNDTTIMLGGQSGNFELNVTLPVIAYNFLQSIDLLSSAVKVFSEKCIAGITANREKCHSNIEKSLALATGLVPHIGYDMAAEVAKKALETGKTIREIVMEDKIVPKIKVDEVLFKGR